MHRAFAHANQRKHQYETLEHLLLALIDDVDASAVMRACKVDIGALRERLTSYLDNDLKTNVTHDGSEPKQSADVVHEGTTMKTTAKPRNATRAIACFRQRGPY
jgi:ATP-dependent Clp protease ATP-binding subunit ClpA